MKDENKCEAPLGGGGIDVCDKFDKHGKHSVGVGKAVANVTYWNQSQGKENTWTYACCKNCTEMYSYMTEENDWEDNVVVKIEYFEKDHPGSFDNTRAVIILDSEASD